MNRGYLLICALSIYFLLILKLYIAHVGSLCFYLVTSCVSASGRFSVWWCYLLMILVKIISFEKLLSGRIFKMDFILFDSFCVFPFLIVYMILIKVFSLWIWLKLGNHSAILQSFPVKIFKPRMSLHFLVPISAKSTWCFSSKTFVNKISSFKTPSINNIRLFNLNLLLQYSISYFSPSLALIWTTTIHAFICNDTDCKVISSNAMVVFTHDFWSHIAWSSTSLITVFDILNPFSSYSEVC